MKNEKNYMGFFVFQKYGISSNIKLFFLKSEGSLRLKFFSLQKNHWFLALFLFFFKKNTHNTLFRASNHTSWHGIHMFSRWGHRGRWGYPWGHNRIWNTIWHGYSCRPVVYKFRIWWGFTRIRIIKATRGGCWICRCCCWQISRWMHKWGRRTLICFWILSNIRKVLKKKWEHQIMIYFFCEIGRKIYIGNRIQS